MNLRTANIDLEGATVHVVGKGRKARTIPLPTRLFAILDGYLADVRPELAASPYLFAGARSLPGRHHPHRWRHAYATGLLRCRRQPRTHPPPARPRLDQTTSRYLHFDLDDLTTAVNHTFDT